MAGGVRSGPPGPRARWGRTPGPLCIWGPSPPSFSDPVATPSVITQCSRPVGLGAGTAPWGASPSHVLARPRVGPALSATCPLRAVSPRTPVRAPRSPPLLPASPASPAHAAATDESTRPVARCAASRGPRRLRGAAGPSPAGAARVTQQDAGRRAFGRNEALPGLSMQRDPRIPER